MTDEPKPVAGGPVQAEGKAVSRFAAHVEMFMKRVDSLADTLPMMMVLQQGLLQNQRKELKEFREKHCQPVPGEEGAFVVPLDHIAAFRRLDDKAHKAHIAMSTIPRSFLVALISEYDAFLSALIRSMYTVQPEMLKASEKSFTFSELLEFGSIEAARAHIIEKEAETVLRDSHSKQFQWLEKKLTCPLTKDLPAWSPFVEITERRNLFVHNDGVVTRQYLDNCREAKCDVGTAKLGERLEVPQRYFQKAHETVSEIALKLAYVMWNKLEPKSDPLPQKHLSGSVVYELVLQGRYRLAIQMGTFGLKYVKPFAEEYDRLTLTLNLAQAYKWSGDQENCDKLIDVDWTAAKSEFQLCVRALKDDVDGVVALMKENGPKAVSKSGYRDWPMFRVLRKNEKFQAAFQEVFNEPLNQVPPPKELKQDEAAKPEQEAESATDDREPTVH